MNVPTYTNEHNSLICIRIEIYVVVSARFVGSIHVSFTNDMNEKSAMSWSHSFEADEDQLGVFL